MPSRYVEKLSRHVFESVEVEVLGAESEEQARDLATLFDGNQEGVFEEEGGILITITTTIEDSDTELVDDEWEEDEDAK